jgi:effector-binding domain-containing protein
MEYQVERVQLIQQPSAVVRGRVPRDGIPGFLGGAFGEVMGVLAAQGVEPAGPPFGCYLPTSDGFDVEAGFPTSAPVEPAGRVVPSTLPGGSAIQVLHRGPYAGVAAAYQAGEVWLAERGGEPTAPPWESYLDEPDVAEPRTLVSMPCRLR